MWTDRPGKKSIIAEKAALTLRTASSIQTSSASLAFVMLCFLVIDEDFEVVEVALAVIAPRSFQYLLQRRVLALVLTHDSSITSTGRPLSAKSEQQRRCL